MIVTQTHINNEVCFINRERMKKFIELLKKLFALFEETREEEKVVIAGEEPVKKPVVEPIVVVKDAPTIEKEKPKEEAVVESIAPHPTPSGPIKIPDLKNGKFIASTDGSGGFVNNPDNSKGTLKIIFPGKYTNGLKEVLVFTEDGSFKERLKNATPNEWGNRERYYGKQNISKYPKNLIVGGKLLNDTWIFVKVNDPQKRQD